MTKESVERSALSKPAKKFHSMDSPPTLVVLLCGLDGG